MLALALGAVLATAFGVYLLWRTGEWALNSLVYENEAFAIQQIDVQTDGVIAVAIKSNICAPPNAVVPFTRTRTIIVRSLAEPTVV